MSNLSIENLSNKIQLDGPAGVASELKATREMEANGLQTPGPGTASTTFSDVLRNSVEKTNEMQHQANEAVHELVAGRSKNIHETMLAIERADSSLKLMMQVRNKILDAYREIMRMQV